MLGRRASHGITLIELMVGLLMLAILGTLAAPSLQALIASSQVTAATNDLLGSLMQARSEAIRLGQRVTVCRSANGQTCDTGTTTGWETGWIVFTDPDRSSGTAAVSAADTLTATAPGSPGDIRITGNQPTLSYVSYAPDGSAKLMSGAPQIGRLQVCSRSPTLDDTRRVRHLVLSMTGRVIVETPTGGVSSACPPP